MTLILIAAVADGGVIGRSNTLPWYLPADLRRFKRLTTGPGYNAEAIDSFYLRASTATHTQPGSLLPSIASATSLTSDVFANGELVVTTYTNGVNAVSSLFMVDNIFKSCQHRFGRYLEVLR